MLNIHETFKELSNFDQKKNDNITDSKNLFFYTFDAGATYTDTCCAICDFKSLSLKFK